ncbi:MAG: hypothetical protein CMJ80_18120 [Planctomycetaceae bacterium]|nr:hypothetical protein [Planctomycetaceae bacterium]
MATVSQTLNMAKSLYRNGDITLAIDLLEHHLENENCGEIWELLGVIYLVENQTERATCALEQSATLRQLSVGGHFALAECYRRREFREGECAIYLQLAGTSNTVTNVSERSLA